MFGKDKEMKIVEKDVGLLEDSWVFLQHAVADESHCLGNFLSSGDDKHLKDLEKARLLRTKILDLISDGVKGQSWCRIKHLSGKAMTIQELTTRFLSNGDFETARQLANYNKDIFVQFLECLGVTKENAKIKSEA